MSERTTMSGDDHARVSEAVHRAEQETSGEIVTIIADHSDRYLDVALWWSVAVAILALAALATFHAPILSLIDGGWDSPPSPRITLEWALAVVIIAFTVTRLAFQSTRLRVALTPGIVKSRRARRRAIRYFKVGAERRTAGRTGILIYLSLIEHRAEIVADERIHSLVPDERWGDAMATMIELVKKDQIADGMIAAVERVGAILSEHFPRSDDDRNELPDRLIEL